MNDLISRQAAIDAVKALENDSFDFNNGLIASMNVIGELPSVTPQLSNNFGECEDCVSRQAAIDAFEPEYDVDWYTPWIIGRLKALPSVTPKPRTGKWIEGREMMNCSECFSSYDLIYKRDYIFCPNCGADMRR